MVFEVSAEDKVRFLLLDIDAIAMLLKKRKLLFFIDAMDKSNIQVYVTVNELKKIQSCILSDEPRLPLINLLQLCKVPEDSIAELGILFRRFKESDCTPWILCLRLLKEYLTLIWVFLIRVRIENIWLPSGDRQTDD
ncbi:MAG: hypothetical protein AAGD25_34415 [Cyanobacteria bacterium P01_F01_bin.150]